MPRIDDEESRKAQAPTLFCFSLFSPKKKKYIFPTRGFSTMNNKNPPLPPTIHVLLPADYHPQSFFPRTNRRVCACVRSIKSAAAAVTIPSISHQQSNKKKKFISSSVVWIGWREFFFFIFKRTFYFSRLKFYAIKIVLVREKNHQIFFSRVGSPTWKGNDPLGWCRRGDVLPVRIVVTMTTLKSNTGDERSQRTNKKRSYTAQHDFSKCNEM